MLEEWSDLVAGGLIAALITAIGLASLGVVAVTAPLLGIKQVIQVIQDAIQY